MSVQASQLESRMRVGRRSFLNARRILGHSGSLLVLAALIGLWQLLVRALGVKEFVLPAPSAVAEQAYTSAGLLWHASLVTLSEILLGFGLTIVVALPVALLIVYSRFVRNLVYPLFVAAQAIPRVAIAPLMVIWFGFGIQSKVLIAFSIAVFPLVINAVVGFSSVERDIRYVVRSMGASSLQTFWKLELPSALPAIFGGLKIASALTVIGAIVGEFVGASKGLGYLVLVGEGTLNTRLIFASVALMAVLGIALFYVIELLERITIHWYTAARKAGEEGSLAE